MLQQATSVNIAIKVIENVCAKLDVELNDTHKTIIAILIPSIIYRDGTIVILSETIHQVNRAIKKRNDKFDFVSLLLGYNCITSIDKYGAITIPLCVLLNKLTVKREIVNNSSKYLSKKVLTNATQTICISEILSHIGVPKLISIPVINIILEMFYTNIEKERKIVLEANAAFKGHKLSETKKILKQMQFEKIFLSTAILIVISGIGLNIGTSLILINVLSEIYEVLKAEYKQATAKSFLKLYKL